MKEKQDPRITAALILGGFILVSVCLGGVCLLSNTLLSALLGEVPGGGGPFILENPCTLIEYLELPYAAGTPGKTCYNSYTGTVAITISGVGNSAGSAVSDAFYLFTDGEGHNIPPEHPEEWVLTINTRLAEEWIPVREVPAYSDDHIYIFEIQAPGGPLTFGIEDGYTGGNNGIFWITI